VRRLIDYYRQFQELSPEEASARLLARRDAERARAVSEVPLLDLSSAAWPRPPHPDAVNAATFALRRSLNAYPDPAPLRESIAARLDVAPEQVAAGHGASELLRAALAAVAPGGEVAIAWPAWGPLPRLVHEAGGTPVAVPLDAAGAPDADALLAAAGPATRAVVLCSPNDPTGAATTPDALRRLAERLPEPVWLLVDAALAPFGPHDPDELLRLRERVVVVHSGAKAHAVAGLPAGYALGPAGPLLERIAPVHGIAAPAQAVLLWALESDAGAASAARRASEATAQRERLAAGLAGTPLRFPPGHSHLVWLGSAAHDGRAIATHLAGRRITAMPGAAWGDDAHVRLALRDDAATDRLVAALREL
jgi:histidinol-phosphate/aromatic aminotransferase/cobyric acid decarboxylase-like protein